MELVNETGLQAGYTLSVGTDGREALVVVVKATYLIPTNPDGEPALAPEQAPLVMTDEFSGEPGFSAPTKEIDYAPRKPRCDILLTGSAYAPGGRATDRVTVSMRVGSVRKSFDVVGNRVWQAGTLTLGISKPEPFTKLPISYDRAFGGVDKAKGDPATFRWYPTNHAGVGWHEYLDTRFLNETPLPNTEETGQPVRKPNGTYRPMAFGPVGRAWQPRPKWAGTYDQKWKDETYPFLPADFDERYFQAAPDDQQTDYLAGGEEVELVNLTPAGRTAFRLPRLAPPVEVFPKAGGRTAVAAVVDTVVLEPDEGRFSLVLRGRYPLRRDLHEVRLVTVGEQPPGWHEERGLDGVAGRKPRYKSLAVLRTLNRPRRGGA
ncbi:MAG TPA: DUF2169 domain-containing protein [Gemmataceae bacterium]|nr:DUF2169 domain-containing protein [Gemmataceae bacterium]